MHYLGILVATGDVLAQQVIQRKKLKDHNFYRTGKFFIIGSCFVTPVLRTWYSILDRFVRGSGGVVAMKKVLLDQTIFAPVFIASFFTVSDILGGKSLEGVKRNLDQNYFSTLKTNYYVWPAVQTVNFYFVPPTYRVILVNTVALFWNTYLAWTVSKTN